MAGWKKVIAGTVSNAEDQFDLLKYRLRERLGGRSPISILPYRGYGRPEQLYLKGRVLEERGIGAAGDNDSLWDNLLNMYKRFKSNEIPQAKVSVRFQGAEQEISSDLEGYFEAWVEPVQPLQAEGGWVRLDLELLHPIREGHPPARAQGQVLVPPSTAHFGVISDVDDTIVRTDASNLLRMARKVFLGNARTRLPFPGVAAFYRALRNGTGSDGNPLFFVSSSPWNLYDLLEQFFKVENIPSEHVIFLRDWGLSESELLPTRHASFKAQIIQHIIDFYPEMPFILIGDSGQEDPEIYSQIVENYPQRILAVYIRDVSRDQERDEQVERLGGQIQVAGSRLVLAEDTLPMAEDALNQGWIIPEALAEIRVEKALNKAAPSRLESLLADEDDEKQVGSNS